MSRGILHAFDRGIVTATGIFANAASFENHCGWLCEHEGLDLGVHLNITDGAPLTSHLRKKLDRWCGNFPDKYQVSLAICRGAIKVNDVEGEWRAQIERCLKADLKISFLNSHEHIHMLPGLFGLVQMLAKEYAIMHVRFPRMEYSIKNLTPSALIRDSLLGILGIFNRRKLQNFNIDCLGLRESGKLSLDYLRRKLPALESDRVFELMCHPGYTDEREVKNSKHLAYHDWQGELDTLTSPDMKHLLKENGICLVGYRHLEIRNKRIVVRAEGMSQ